MIQMIILWSLHSVQYSFQFAEEKSGVTFVCFYLNLGTFVRSFTEKGFASASAFCNDINPLRGFVIYFLYSRQRRDIQKV